MNWAKQIRCEASFLTMWLFGAARMHITNKANSDAAQVLRWCGDAATCRTSSRFRDFADWVRLHGVQMRFRGSCDQLVSTSAVFGGSLWLCYFSETELHLFNKCKVSISDGSVMFWSLCKLSDIVIFFSIYRWWHCKAKATTLMVFWACDLGCVSVKASEFQFSIYLSEKWCFTGRHPLSRLIYKETIS